MSSNILLLGGCDTHTVHLFIGLTGAVLSFFVYIVVRGGLSENKSLRDNIPLSYLKFFYASFLRPHSGTTNPNQQSALESFYETQVEKPALLGPYCLLITAGDCVRYYAQVSSTRS